MPRRLRCDKCGTVIHKHGKSKGGLQRYLCPNPDCPVKSFTHADSSILWVFADRLLIQHLGLTEKEAANKLSISLYKLRSILKSSRDNICSFPQWMGFPWMIFQWEMEFTTQFPQAFTIHDRLDKYVTEVMPHLNKPALQALFNEREVDHRVTDGEMSWFRSFWFAVLCLFPNEASSSEFLPQLLREIDNDNMEQGFADLRPVV